MTNDSIERGTEKTRKKREISRIDINGNCLIDSEFH